MNFISTRPSLYTPPNLLEKNRWHNRRIGLFGGSFNPPHEGHMHVAQSALSALKLDSVWWLVTPQNPLKTEKPLSTPQRLSACQDLVNHPKMLITDIEHNLNTHTSFETVQKLKTHFPTTQFVWVSGIDNALSLHRWNDWRALLQLIPFFHITRPPADSLVKNCPLRYYAPQAHHIITRAGHYPLTPRRSYWMMSRKMNAQSSSKIRKQLQSCVTAKALSHAP